MDRQFVRRPNGDVVVCLSAAEAKGLLALAGEGASGLLEDADAARAYIGNAAQVAAAKSALSILGAAAT